MSFLTASVLSAACVLVLLVIIFVNEFLGLFLILAARTLATPLSEYSSGLPGLNAAGAFGAFLVLLALAYALMRRNVTINVFPIPLAGVFLLLSLFSLYNTESVLVSTAQFAKYLACVCVFFLVYNVVKTSEDAAKGLRYFSYISIPLLTIAAYHHFTGQAFVAQVHADLTLSKVRSTFAHPNQFAFFLGLVVLALLMLLRIEPRRKLLWTPLLLAVSVTILFTYSRSVWLSISCCAFYLLIRQREARIPTIVATILIATAFAPMIIDRFDDIINPPTVGQSSLEFRVTISEQLYERAVPQHPILGFGLGSAPEVARRYTDYPTVPHNDYMRVLVETGVVGLFGFLVMILGNIIYVLAQFRKSRRSPYLDGLVAAVAYFSVIIIGTNHWGNVATSGMWFALFALLLRGHQLSAGLSATRTARAHTAPLSATQSSAVP